MLMIIILANNFAYYSVFCIYYFKYNDAVVYIVLVIVSSIVAMEVPTLLYCIYNTICKYNSIVSTIIV